MRCFPTAFEVGFYDDSHYFCLEGHMQPNSAELAGRVKRYVVRWCSTSRISPFRETPVTKEEMQMLCKRLRKRRCLSKPRWENWKFGYNWEINNKEINYLQ